MRYPRGAEIDLMIIEEADTIDIKPDTLTLMQCKWA